MESVEQPPCEAPNALRRGEVHRLRAWRWLAFWPAALGLDGYFRSLRLRFTEGEEALLRETPGPRLIVAWHNRSLLFPALVRSLPRESVHVLISASRLAAWEVAYYAHRGLPAIRGSTTRGGSVAVKEALRCLNRGEDVALSPDGPSGPLYTVQRGVAMLARHSGASLVLVGANCPGARRLRTWDHHLVPWPGQQVTGRIRVYRHFSELGARDDVDACARIRAALLEINHP